MEAAKENGDNCARGNARGSSPYSSLKPATASAKLLTLRCAHMTRSAVRDAHPATLMPRAPPLRYRTTSMFIMYIQTCVRVCMRVYACVCVLCTQQWPGLPGNLTHSTTLVAYIYRSAFLFSKFDGFREFEKYRKRQTVLLHFALAPRIQYLTLNKRYRTRIS